jgi:ABC-type glycerol-3-phosphate transport system substrate-binding protein
MFKKYNVPVPTNLNELIRASSKFRGRNIAPIGVGAMDGWTLTTLFGMITAQTTGVSELTSNFGSDANAFENIPGIKDAFTIYGKLVSNSIPQNSIDINYRQSVDDFVKGKSAMLPSMSTTSTLIDQIKPSGLNYDVFEVPVSFVDEPKASVSASGGQVIALPSNSKKNKEAQKFIEFLFSEEAQKIIVEKGYMSPVIAANKKESDIKEKIASHLEMTNDNSIMLMDNLELSMAENTTRILQDILEGRVKASEGWKRILKLTFQ